MKRSARNCSLEPIGLVLQRDAGLRVPASVETSPVAFRDWEAAVGSRIAARARPVRLERGVLTVRTATSTWAQELALLSDPILAQLRARGVAVDTLRFRVGHVEAPERPPQRDEVRTAPPEVPLAPDLSARLAAIADPELRDAIAHAAAKNLGWQVALNKPKKARAPRRPAPPKPAAPARPPEKPAAARPPAPPPAPTSAPSGARGPRSAGTGSGPPDRSPKPARGASRGKP
jgi:hypothetical protein